MNLDISYFEFIKKNEIRVLTAIEMGMRNHDWVPLKLIEKFADLKRGNAYKIIQHLLKHKLIAHTGLNYDGYRLNFSGYDYLALNVFLKAGLISKLEMKIGAGKESDVYIARSPENKVLVLKLARLGRTSFKTVKEKRDYLGKMTDASWLLLSKISSQKEFQFMEALYEVN